MKKQTNYTEEKIYSIIVDIIHKKFDIDIDDITITKKLSEDLNISDLNITRLMHDIDIIFKIHTSENIFKYKTISDIVNFVKTEITK